MRNDRKHSNGLNVFQSQKRLNRIVFFAGAFTIHIITIRNLYVRGLLPPLCGPPSSQRKATDVLRLGPDTALRLLNKHQKAGNARRKVLAYLSFPTCQAR